MVTNRSSESIKIIKKTLTKFALKKLHFDLILEKSSLSNYGSSSLKHLRHLSGQDV